MNLFIIPICVVSFFLFFKLFKKADREFYEERKLFVDYLDSINDLETLKRIGEINMFGVRERWYPRYTNVMPYLEKKIQETNDEKYILYQEAYEKFIKNYLRTMPFIVLSIIIPLGCIVSLFKH